MTIAVNITVPEGIVLAADSRQTYTNTRGDVRVHSDYAYKLYQINSRVVAMTWGWAFLLGRNIHSHVNDYKLSQSIENQTVEGIAKGLGRYLTKQYRAHIKHNHDKPVDKNDYATGLLIAGYDPGDKTGKVFEVYIPKGECYQRANTSDDPGALWRGHTLVISRLIKGYDPRLRQIEGFNEQLDKSLDSAPLDYKVYYRSMPLQDAIDLSIFLVHTTIQTERFTDGVALQEGSSAVCGGPIDVAVVEPDRGVRWIQRKALQGERSTMTMVNSET